MDIDVVVPAYCWKQEHVPMSLKCIALAREKTNLPFRLIVVETISGYLSSLADIYIWERDRTSSTKSMNRAFSICDADHTVILTNDVYVSDGWLEALIQPFNIHADCGISTLGSTQFGHQKCDKLEEGNWFSVASWKTNGRIFDERYDGVWDDTDFIMSNHVSGKKFYQNMNCIVDHLVGATHYETKGHNERFSEGQKLFREKWKEHINDPYFRKLAGYAQ